MDNFLDVFRLIGEFFIHYCSVVLDFGNGISFTVGAMFVWCGLAVIFIAFMRRLS